MTAQTEVKMGFYHYTLWYFAPYIIRILEDDPWGWGKNKYMEVRFKPALGPG